VRELDRALLVLGRDAKVADLRIDDATVSRRHALVEVEGERVRITDLGSTTGTKINGARLQPDVPSTLEPGDFVHLGRAVLSFHVVAPPAAPSAPPRRGAAAPAPGARTFPWPWVALGLALVVVGLAGALVALNLSGSAPQEEASAPEERAPASPAPGIEEPEPPPVEKPPPREPVPEPEPKPAGPPQAPAGALPPGGYVRVQDFPDLLEIEGERHLAVRIGGWDRFTVRAVGRDGRLYVVPRGKVTKIEDRADLARRAALEHGRLDPEDADGRVALARWCVRRLIRPVAKRLLDEVARLRPMDDEAARLRARLGEE